MSWNMCKREKKYQIIPHHMPHNVVVTHDRDHSVQAARSG
jgi:hypothetical protein